MLINRMIVDGESGEWNFGPLLDEKYSVAELVETFAKYWKVNNEEQSWNLEEAPQPHEAGYLLLDSSKARERLGWCDKLDFEHSIQMTVEWYKQSVTKNPLEVTMNQVRSFLETC